MAATMRSAAMMAMLVRRLFAMSRSLTAIGSGSVSVTCAVGAAIGTGFPPLSNPCLLGGMLVSLSVGGPVQDSFAACEHHIVALRRVFYRAG